MEPEDIARAMSEDASGKIIIKMKRGTEIAADAVKRGTRSGTIYVGIGAESVQHVVDHGIVAARMRKNPLKKFVRMTAPGETVLKRIDRYKRAMASDTIIQNLRKNADWHRTEYIFSCNYRRILTINPDNIASIDGKPVEQWEG